MPPEHAPAELHTDHEGGGPKAAYNDVISIWYDVMRPIIDLYTACLHQAGEHGMDDLVTRFLVFKLLLGMMRPRRIDDVWDPKQLSYNRHQAQLLTRREYYTLNRLLRPAVDALLETCNTTWEKLWVWGEVVAGDESICPHTGQYAGPLRQFIPRKPHSTGIKLYSLADGANAYVINVYLYTGARGVLRTPTLAAGIISPRVKLSISGQTCYQLGQPW